MHVSYDVRVIARDGVREDVEPGLRVVNPNSEETMTFFNEAFPFYCGIDLHAKSMYCCIIDQAGKKVAHITQDQP